MTDTTGAGGSTRSAARTNVIRAAKYTAAGLLRCGQVLLIVLGALGQAAKKGKGSGWSGSRSSSSDDGD
ncbi:hypothetical protein OG785_11205 [Streptomyces sp. NBC_00006]|uniref:hypothetical protein n=1 Tax=Streptomyces sp. NBC_00006 TaxID=2975619 RepID=UPI002250A8C5|nr:hypothetical protein [Streptomyces sp. NBC_00006]MCX5531125.1 hypothetical protein [Streptomyces sp. NBC_00006]